MLLAEQCVSCLNVNRIDFNTVSYINSNMEDEYHKYSNQSVHPHSLTGVLVFLSARGNAEPFVNLRLVSPKLFGIFIHCQSTS